MGQASSHRLYTEFADWWPLLSPPEKYDDEAAFIRPFLELGVPPEDDLTLLELGSGAGGLASHFKDRFDCTLTDLSPDMLAVNRRLNPECEHVAGDMRSLDLGRQFDRVLIYDAIMYATEPAQVRATLETAATHCADGGRIVVLPDCVEETFEPSIDHGGRYARDGRSLRYVEWTWDPAPNDHTCMAAFTLLLREPGREPRLVGDIHEFGCFPRQSWLDWFAELGLEAEIFPDPWERELFVATR